MSKKKKKEYTEIDARGILDTKVDDSEYIVDPHSVIYDLIGTGDYEGFIFAQCSSKKLAKIALQIMLFEGYEKEFLEIRESNMKLNQLWFDDDRKFNL